MNFTPRIFWPSVKQFVGDPAGSTDCLRNPTFMSFLDLARWTSAWIVFLGHLRNPLFFGFERVPASDRLLPVKVWFFVTGWFGEAVIVFFVLSGFLVGAVALARASAGIFSFSDYMIDRVSRIFLPFLPALVLTVLCDTVGASFVDDFGLYDHSHPMIREKVHSEPFSSLLGVKAFILNAAMLQTIIAPPLGSNQPLWTISLEFWFYAAFGFVAAAVATRGEVQRLRNASLVTTAVALSLLLGKVFLIHFGLWLVGVSIAYFGSKAERPLLALTVFFVVLIAGRLFKGTIVGYDLVILRNYLVALSFAWLLLSMRKAQLPALEYMRPLNAFMASFSFSLYLIHFPLMLLLIVFFGAIGFDGVASGYSPASIDGLIVYVLIAMSTGATALVFSRLTEAQTPRMRASLKRWFRRLRPQNVTGAN